MNILLHRPLLARQSSPHTDRAAIVECLSSASAITIIFGSFSLTYGHGYSIMTLSYSIYVAASIFLLQIRATQPPEPKMVERLQFCIEALESVSSVNAGASMLDTSTHNTTDGSNSASASTADHLHRATAVRVELHCPQTSLFGKLDRCSSYDFTSIGTPRCANGP